MLPDNFEIVRANSLHLDSIVEIENICFGIESFNRRQLLYLINKSVGGCFVACVQSRVVAYISLLNKANAKNVRIYSIAVSPDFRKLGIAQAMIDYAIDFAKIAGKTLSLEVNPNNKPALLLYQKNGFVFQSELLEYYHDGASAWRMVKK